MIDNEDLHAMILKYHQQLRRIKDESGQNVTDNYKKLPDRETDPEYYVKNRIDKQKYTSIGQWIQDVELLIENARLLAEGNKQGLADAFLMQKFLDEVAKPSFPDWKFPEAMHAEEQTGEDKAKSPVPIQPYLTQAPSSQIKFLHTYSYNNVNFVNGECILLPNEDDSQHPFVARITRLWKYNNIYGVVVSLFIKPSYIPTDIVSTQDIEENEIFASHIFKIYFAHQLLGKATVRFNADLKNDASATVYYCRKFYDAPRTRFYPFNLQPSFVLSLQAALDHRKQLKHEARKLFCAYDAHCDRSFHSADALLKHATDHILQMPELIYSASVAAATTPKTPSRGGLSIGGGTPYTTPKPTQFAMSTLPSNLQRNIEPESSHHQLSLPTVTTTTIHPDYPRKVSKGGAENKPIIHLSSSSELISLFQTDAQSNLVWFPTPPKAAQSKQNPIHSLEYLEYIAKTNCNRHQSLSFS